MQRELRSKVFDLFRAEGHEYILAGCKHETQLGLDVSIMLDDNERTFITRENHYANYCGVVRNNVTSPSSCRQCDRWAFAEARKSRHIVEYECHAWLRDFCIPIIEPESGDFMAAIFGGQLLLRNGCEPNSDDYLEKVSNLEKKNGVPPGTLWELRKKVKVVDPTEYSRFVAALERIAGDLSERFKHYSHSVMLEFLNDLRDDFAKEVLAAMKPDRLWEILARNLPRATDCWDIERIQLYIYDTNSATLSLKACHPPVRPGVSEAEANRLRQHLDGHVWTEPPFQAGHYFLPIATTERFYGVVVFALKDLERRSAKYMENADKFFESLLFYVSLRLKALETYEEEQRHKEALERKNAELLSAKKLMEDLTVTLTHQVASPLTSIRGLLARVIDEADALAYAARKKRLEAIFDIALDGCTLLRAVMEALDTSRILEENLQEIDVAEEIKKVTDRRKQLITEKSLRVKLSFNRDMPKVGIVKSLFLHVIYVLLDNAVKYSDEDEGIYIRGSLHVGNLDLEVESCGAFILPEEVETIFERGERGSQAYQRDTVDSSGMGLWIARTLLTAVGGKIFVKVLGRTSTFCVSIPVSTN